MVEEEVEDLGEGEEEGLEDEAVSPPSLPSLHRCYVM